MNPDTPASHFKLRTFHFSSTSSRRRRIESVLVAACLAFSGLVFAGFAGFFLLATPPARGACNPATKENCCSSNLVGYCGFVGADATGICTTASCDSVTFTLAGLYPGTNTVTTNVVWTSSDPAFSCPAAEEVFRLDTPIPPAGISWVAQVGSNVVSGTGETATVGLPADTCSASCLFSIPSSGTCGSKTNTQGASVTISTAVTVTPTSGPPRFCMLDVRHSPHAYKFTVDPPECFEEISVVPGPEGAYADILNLDLGKWTFDLLGTYPGTSAWVVVDARCGVASQRFDVVRLDEFSLFNTTCNPTGACPRSVTDGSDDDASPSGTNAVLDLMQQVQGGSVTADLYQAWVPYPIHGKDIHWFFTNASWKAPSGTFAETNRIQVVWDEGGNRRDILFDWFDCEPDGHRADGSDPAFPEEPRRRLETCVAFFQGLEMQATDATGLVVVAKHTEKDPNPGATNASDFVCSPGSTLVFKPITVEPEGRELVLDKTLELSAEKPLEMDVGDPVLLAPNEWRVDVGKECPEGLFTLKLKDSKHDCVWEEHDVLVSRCGSCVVCQDFGGFEGELGCVDLVFGLGLLPGGGRLPGLRLRADTIDGGSFSPAAILPPHRRYVARPDGPACVPYVSPFYTTRYDADGNLRQVRVLDGLVDILSVGGTTHVRYYRASVLAGGAVASMQLFPLPAPGEAAGIQPFVEYRISVAAALGGAPATAIVEEHRDGAPVRTMCFLQEASGRWVREVRDPNLEDYPVVRDTLHTTDLPGGLQRTERTFLDATGNPLSISASDIATLSDGTTKVAVRESTGVGAAALCTTNAYVDAPGTAAHGKLYSSVRPDGSWTWRTYDGSGRPATETSPFGDAAPVLDASGAVTDWTGDAVRRTYSYAPVDPLDDGTLDPDAPRTVTEEVGRDGAWTVVRRSFTARYNAGGYAVEVSEQAASPSAAYGDAANLRTVAKRHVGAPHAGRPASRLSPDGSLTRHLYTVGAWDPADPDTFTPVEFGGYLLTETVEGTADLPDGIADRSTRTRTVTDLYGRTRYSSTLLYRGPGEPMPVLGWTLYTLDDDGRVAVEASSDGRVVETQWGCCGPEVRTSAEGVATSHLYDAAKRLVLTATHNGVADVLTRHAYDSAGRRAATLVTADGLVQLTTNVYDTLGRLAWTRGPDGIRTDYEYYAGGRISRTIRAGLGTEAEGALDGGAKATRVNGELRSRTVRGVNPDGTRWTTVYEGPLGTNSPAWTRTTTDFLGRTLLEERPAFGDGILVSSNAYDAVGRLVRATTGHATASNFTLLTSSLFAYDSLGDRFRTTQDLDLDGVVDLAGPDRVTDTQTSYASYASHWFRESRQYVYPEDNATPKQVSTQRQRLTGLGAAVAGGILVGESQSLDLLGNPTVSRTVLDRAARRVVQSSDGPASTLDALAVSVNGLTLTNVTATGVTTIHAYDALGRRILSRTGDRLVALSGYDTLGQLAWTADAANTTNRFVYDAFTGRRVAVTNALGQTTHTAYDAEGRILATWGATYPIAYEYDASGRMVAMATTRDPAHESVNLLTLLPEGLTLSDVSDPGYPSDLDTTRWLYDESTGLLTNKVYADGKGAAYAYTPDGRLATRIWARGITTAYGYTSSGELEEIAYSDGTPSITYTFDRLGRQKTVTDASGQRTFAYNDLLQLAAETNAMAVVERRYDALGRDAGLDVGRSSPSEPSSYAVAYGYDEFGRFHSISSSVFSVSSVVNYSRLPGTDLISGWTDSISGASVSRSYEAHRDLLVAVTNSVGATMISAYDYANDAMGRRTQRLDAGANAATNHFAYNVRSELTNAVMPVLADEVQQANAYSWTLDPIGNRQASTHNDETRTFEANALNQYTTISVDSVPPRETPLHYDNDGNLTNDAVFAYVYNGDNRLTLAEPLVPAVGAKRVRNAYDHQGRRFEKVVDEWTGAAWANVATNHFVYDGWNVIAEVGRQEAGVSTNFYVRGLDLSGTLQGAGGIGGLLSILTPDSGLLSTFFDGNGNLVQTVDSNATVTAFYVYDAYGNTLVQSGPYADQIPYRFSSQYFDAETSLYMYIFRAYSPKLERWMNRDPTEERGFSQKTQRLGATAKLDIYQFVLNSPMSAYDILGLDTFGEFVSGWFDKRCAKCGPDVTEALKRTKTEVEREFGVLNKAQRDANCDPFFSNLFDSPIYAATGWDMASFSSDVRVRRDGEPPITICPFGYRCSSSETVTVDGKCHWKWSVNYLLYGWMGRLCNADVDRIHSTIWRWNRFNPGKWADPMQMKLDFALAGFAGFPETAVVIPTDEKYVNMGCKPCTTHCYPSNGDLNSRWPDVLRGHK